MALSLYDSREHIISGAWLALDESERMQLVARYHRRQRIRLPVGRVLNTPQPRFDHTTCHSCRILRLFFESGCSRSPMESSKRLPHFMYVYISSLIRGFGFVLLFAAASVFGQTACTSVQSKTATPADAAYGDSDYEKAEQLYMQALAQEPNNSALGVGLVRTLLHEGKVAEAAERVQTIVAADPHSAATLTAAAEVQLRLGQPWQAKQTLDAAEAADRCFARSHLIRSRVLRIDSMYASERAELQKAYDIDPTDPDILNAWNSVVPPAQEIEGVQQSLTTMKDLDAETRQKAEGTAESMMPLLSENSQTCKVLPSIPSATLTLLPSKQDGKNIDGYRVAVQLPKSAAKLVVDSAASGLFITRALADANGLKQRASDPQGTVRLDSVHIGPLEFRDCLVGVSDTPFIGKADGFIGTDIFASYLIKIDPRAEKLTLGQLPALTGTLPGDRPTLPELAGFTPVYHRRQYLLVPVALNNKSRQLFVLDTGMRFSTMTSETAHAVSNMKVNFTNTMQTASGAPAHVYRDSFDFQFANLALPHQNHVLEFDPAAIDHNAGFEVGGLLGFEMLHELTLQLDYRDGLVKFESTESEVTPLLENRTMVALAATAPENNTIESACQPHDNVDRPLNSTIEAKITGGIDSGRLKPGKEVWVKVVNGYVYPGCRMEAGSILYGHVTSANSSKNPNASELSLLFDHGDCDGHARKQLSLRLIGLVAPPDESRRMHSEIPVEVAGGTRQIGGSSSGSDAVTALNGMDESLTPGSAPPTVHPGIVVNMPALKLEPEGGPGCSAKITSTSRSITLGTGAELLLTMSTVAE
jgi:tetratricopeptide (TPR) repeat protein